MPTYTVTDKTGRAITKGDTVTDFRGDTAIFQRVSRGVEYNGTAKVIVTTQSSDGPRDWEYYERVFGLTVVTDPSEIAPEDATPAAELAAAIVRMGERMRSVDDGARALNCSEAESIANVLRLAGRTDDADAFIECHAWGDDDSEDVHRARYLELHKLPADHDA